MEKQTFEQWFKRHSALNAEAAKEVLRLHQSGKPAAVIAQCDRDAIAGLTLAQVYEVIEAESEWKEISRRREHILQEIAAQDKLTDELKESIERSHDLDRLEDIYVPFKLKRQTLGVQAREAGLDVFADYLWKLGHNEATQDVPGETLLDKAKNFAKVDSKYPDADAVLKGAGDILVEQIAENTQLRSLVRSAVLRRSKLRCSKGTKAKANTRYAKYFDYQEPVGSLKKGSSGFRYLQMRKGWMEDELVLSFERPDEGQLLEKFEEFACLNKESLGAELLVKAARLALKGNVYTVMENEAHRRLKEQAEKHVIESLGEAFAKKLLRAPFGAKAVMGIDVGSEAETTTVVLIDENGKYLIHSQIKTTEASVDPIRSDILKMIDNAKVQALAIAHGPKSKELRTLFKQILGDRQIPIVNMHEHSASIYASSGAAKEEFADFDMNIKRAIFVARFLQDPMLTLMRLDTKYVYLHEIQHELNGNQLRQGLMRALEDVVSKVGVDLNFVHSPHILTKVPGISLDLAKKILEHKDKMGKISGREDLKEILGDRFPVSSSFFRFANGTLDHTGIESRHYEVINHWIKDKGLTLGLEFFAKEHYDSFVQDEGLRSALGPKTQEYAAEELKCYAIDYRGNFDGQLFASGLNSVEDLKPDTAYPGLVTNVTTFGAFIDLGLEQDGLVHLTELGDQHKSLIEMLTPGDRVLVWVLGVNQEKKQISLTMKSLEDREAAIKARSRRRPPRREGESGARVLRRGPRRDQLNGADLALGAESTQGGQPASEHRREGRRFNRNDRNERGERRNPRHRGPREEPKPVDPKEAELAAIRAKRKMTRDPKTGAIVQFDEGGGGRRGTRPDGPRVATKAKPHTFNPFANLGNLLKDKSKT